MTGQHVLLNRGYAALRILVEQNIACGLGNPQICAKLPVDDGEVDAVYFYMLRTRYVDGRGRPPVWTNTEGEQIRKGWTYTVNGGWKRNGCPTNPNSVH